MDLTNMREVNMLCDWALAHEKKEVFDGYGKNTDSYFIDRISDNTYMMEYEVDDIGELSKLICENSRGKIDDEALKILSVAALKCKPDSIKNGDAQNSDISKIPEYIYNF